MWPGRTHGDVADILAHWSPFLSERAAVIAYVRERERERERERGRERGREGERESEREGGRERERGREREGERARWLLPPPRKLFSSSFLRSRLEMSDPKRLSALRRSRLGTVGNSHDCSLLGQVIHQDDDQTGQDQYQEAC